MKLRYPRTIAFVLGLLFLLVISEVGLRIFGSFQNSESAKGVPAKVPGEFRVLFVGNSHTAGAGVEKGASYPFVLNRMFHQPVGHPPLVAYNMGLGNGNTTILNERAQIQIDVLKPDLVFIMAGEPNIWNLYGYAEFLNNKNGSSSDTESFLQEKLSHLRLLRWLFYLPELRKKNDNEHDAYEILAWTEDGIFKRSSFTMDEVKRMHAVVTEFLKRHEGETLPARQYFLQMLAHLEIKYLNQTEKGFAHYAEALKEGKAMFRVPFERDFNLPGVNNERLILLKTEIQKRDAIQGEIKKAFNEKNIPALEMMAEKDPASVTLSRSLFELLRDKNECLKFALYWDKFMHANPLEVVDKRLYFIPSDLPDNHRETEAARASITKTIAWFDEKFPSEKLRFNRNHDVSGWIKADLTRLVRKYKSSGATIVLQNYHGLRSKAQSDTLRAVIEEVARNEKVLYLDTEKFFKAGMVSDKSDYFTKRFGPNDDHPSELGHELIARIILDFMKENKLLPDKFEVKWEQSRVAVP